MVLSIILIIGVYMNNENSENGVLLNSSSTRPPKQDTKAGPDNVQPSNAKEQQPETGVGKFIGKNATDILTSYGEPLRKDPSAYGYEWWIYKDGIQYFQFGVLENKVVTVYAAGKTDVSPFKLGQQTEEIFQANYIGNELVVEVDGGNYRFELTEEDFNIRPLIPLGDVFAQLYIDKFTGTLSSVRFITKEMLVKQRPYEMVYRGELLSAPEPNDELWKQVEKGSEQQILDITNIIRYKFELDRLEPEPRTAAVAKKHSQEMFDKQYFAHESPSKGDLGDRLKSDDIEYKTAGENIAANYIDGPAAVEGWLNSEGHRKAMLEEEFTYLGVGVYRKYYTQNFIDK